VSGLEAAMASGVAASRVSGRNVSATRDLCSNRKYDERPGQLRFIHCDVDRNGRVDTVLITPADGTHAVEFDTNEDGLVDRADIYDVNQILVTIAYDRQPDGSFARVERVNGSDNERALPAGHPALPVPPQPDGTK